MVHKLQAIFVTLFGSISYGALNKIVFNIIIIITIIENNNNNKVNNNNVNNNNIDNENNNNTNITIKMIQH